MSLNMDTDIKKIFILGAAKESIPATPIDLESLGYEQVFVVSPAHDPDGASHRQGDEFLDQNFANPSAAGACHAYITSPHLLSRKLAEECDQIFLDLRFEPTSSDLDDARQPKVTLITSMFKTDEFIEGFLNNCNSLNLYRKLCNHVFVASKLSALERHSLLQFSKRRENIVIVWNREDPGLYNCWQQGIQLATTPYISNANVDDLRHSLHVSELVQCLDDNPDAGLATTAIVPFYTYTPDLTEIDASAPWFVDQAGQFNWWQLAMLEHGGDGYSLKPNNLPHSSPMWRKSLHEDYGYFDEESFGTFADWAFWLKVFQSGQYGILSPKPYGYYYINLESHNRRGQRLDEFHHAIENQFIGPFIERHETPATDGANPGVQHKAHSTEPKLMLCGKDQVFGEHRNSFNRLVTTLEPLHSRSAQTKFIPFIERYFVWGTDDGEAASAHPRPLMEDWIGVIHCPFDSPGWFDRSISPETIFSSDLWKQSEPFCRGLICLSEDLEIDLNNAAPHLSSLSVKHPTELNVSKFDPQKYRENPRIVQVGDWLRKLQTIHRIDGPGHERIFLTKSSTNKYLEREILTFGDFRSASVNVRHFVSNTEYDDLLGSSVVLCLMYGTAANNALIECIARSTPIIINPLPSVVEYLGAEYPLYAETPHAIDQLLMDETRVEAAHIYLEGLDKTFLSYDQFCQEISDSKLYSSLRA